MIATPTVRTLKQDATALRRGGSRFGLNSGERETPRDKPVASENLGGVSDSGKRETPRDKPVASVL
jgi:hypothetical protein